MADFELRYRKGSGLVSRVFGAVGVGALVTSLEDQERDAADPKVVTWTERSSALRVLATDLVDAGRYDERAAGELADAAGRHVRELQRAAAAVRQGGWAAEDERCARIDRLLLAAAGRRAPEPVGDDERAWFAEVRDLVGLPRAEGFAVLSAAEPALAAYEGDVLRFVAEPGFGDWDEDRRSTALDGVLDDRLVGIVDRSPSRLLQTRAAWHVLVAVGRSHLGLPALEPYGPPW